MEIDLLLKVLEPKHKRHVYAEWFEYLEPNPQRFAGTVTALRMSEAIMSPWNSLSKADKEKLLKNGIDQQMHRRMFMQIDRHGDQVDGEWLPNTDLWTDATARLKFRAALNQNVERIIITPGAGDRALWTSRELGSLMTQFKSFGQAATVRLDFWPSKKRRCVLAGRSLLLDLLQWSMRLRESNMALIEKKPSMKNLSML